MMTLEQLEKDYWPAETSFPTPLVEKCYRLRKVPVGDLEPDDLRVLITQQIGLRFLVPLAIQLLENDPMMEAEYYPGDLLEAVIDVKSAYWEEYPEQYKSVLELMERKKE